MDLIGCISLEGQSLLLQVEVLERGQVFSPVELRGVASALALVSVHATPPKVGGDVKVAGKLLNQLVLQMDILLSTPDSEGVGAGLPETMDSLARVASNLLNPDLLAAWMGVVEGVVFSSEDLLFSIEAFGRVRGRYLRNNVSSTRGELREQNLLLVTQPLLSHDFTQASPDPFVLTFNDSTATISLGAATPLLSATFGLFPTLGDLLDLRAEFNISNLFLATPILSVQAADAEGSEFTRVTVNLTLQFGRPVVREELADEAVCVSWGSAGGR